MPRVGLRAVAVFERAQEDALTHLSFPGSHPTQSCAQDHHARAPTQGGKEYDEGGGSVPERAEHEYVGHGVNLEGQRGMGAKALPDDGRSRSGRKTKPTTFKTLTIVPVPTRTNYPCTEPLSRGIIQPREAFT